MGRSQRHLLDEHGSTSAGEIHAQGVVADGIMMQVDPSNPGVLLRSGAGGVVVPVGDLGGPLSGSSLTGAIPAEAPTPIGDAPRLTSLSPTSAPIQSGDVALQINGAGFTEASVLVWNGADDTASYVTESIMTTTVKTDLSTIPSTCTVAVRNGDMMSNQLPFELTGTMPEGLTGDQPAEEPVTEVESPVERVFPIGPTSIGLISDNVDGLEIGLIDMIDVQVGDKVLIEATFNGEVNGEYTVLTINPIVVDNDLILEAPIENKGRLTVTAGA